VLIYVFDVESRELEKDMHYYQSCLEALLANSKDAKIFCLVHKMDLVNIIVRKNCIFLFAHFYHIFVLFRWLIIISEFVKKLWAHIGNIVNYFRLVAKTGSAWST